MKTRLLQMHPTDDLLKMLQVCAHKLLLAYDETLQPDLWEAFEKTAQVCQMLMSQESVPLSMKIH